MRPVTVACLVLMILLAAGCGYQSLLGPTAPDAATRSRPAEGSQSAQGSPSANGTREILAVSSDQPRDTSRPTRLAVIALRNDSPEPWLDRIVTESMRREMGTRGGFDLVNDPGRADLIIRGRIRPIGNRAESYSSFVAAVEFAITLALDLEVVRRGGDIVRLDSAMLSETDVYLASGDIEVTRTNRLELLRHLSDLLAARVADSLELMQRPIGPSPGGADG
jgi:hypothetical protein